MHFEIQETKYRAWDLVSKRMKENDELWNVPFNELFVSTPDSRPYVMMQYSGLNDKNGTEIYEGDILEVSTEKEQCLVRKEQGAFIVGYHEGSSTRKRPKLIQPRFCKVVGNVFENPKILERMNPNDAY